MDGHFSSSWLKKIYSSFLRNRKKHTHTKSVASFAFFIINIVFSSSVFTFCKRKQLFSFVRSYVRLTSTLKSNWDKTARFSLLQNKFSNSSNIFELIAMQRREVKQERRQEITSIFVWWIIMCTMLDASVWMHIAYFVSLLLLQSEDACKCMRLFDFRCVTLMETRIPVESIKYVYRSKTMQYNKHCFHCLPFIRNAVSPTTKKNVVHSFEYLWTRAHTLIHLHLI